MGIVYQRVGRARVVRSVCLRQIIDLMFYQLNYRRKSPPDGIRTRNHQACNFETDCARSKVEEHHASVRKYYQLMTDLESVAIPFGVIP